MKKHFGKSVITVLVIGAVLVFSVNVFAGKGYGRMGWGGGSQGQGYGPCGGPGYAADMNEEDVKKMETQRNTFFEATADLRQEVHQKRLALRSELAKKDPDTAVAKALQKEISALQAQLGEKRLDHMIEMKKINPNAGGRWMSGGGHMGSGPGQGRGWHRGPWSGGQGSN
jgi:zinc resistance-associated protein